MTNAIEKLFQEAQSKATGLLAAGFMDLATGKTVYLHGDVPVPTASVYKIFILARLFQMQKEGSLCLSSKHVLTEDEISIGSGILDKSKVGTEYSLMDYVMLMMSVSDNTATDYLASLTGFDSIRQYVIEALGLTSTKCELNCMDLLTRCYGVSAEEYLQKCDSDTWFDAHMGSYFRCEEAVNNQTTAKDIVRFFSLLYNGQLVDPDSDRQMLDIMAQCQTNSRIPAKLPDGVTVAHKTGSIDHLANDAGIVMTQKGDYVLALFYNGNVGTRAEYDRTSFSEFGTQILSDLSYQVYQTYMANT